MPTKKPSKPLEAALTKLEDSRKKAVKKRPAPVPQMVLDLWPEAVRGVPNAVLRGALFTVSKRRTWADRDLIASIDGIEIKFKGERFNQTDLDTWEMVLHLARLQPLGNKVDFTARTMLRALGRGVGESQHKQLHEELVRLRAGTAEIRWTKEKKTFVGGLITSFGRDDETGRYVVTLDPKMLTLYETGYSRVDWEQRQALGANNLAKWLHGFYSSHADPYPYKVATLRELCGSTTKELREFRRSIKKALEELVAIKAIISWSISDQDLVSIVRVPSISQQKHLMRRGR